MIDVEEQILVGNRLDKSDTKQTAASHLEGDYQLFAVQGDLQFPFTQTNNLYGLPIVEILFNTLACNTCQCCKYATCPACPAQPACVKGRGKGLMGFYRLLYGPCQSFHVNVVVEPIEHGQITYRLLGQQAAHQKVNPLHVVQGVAILAFGC